MTARRPESTPSICANPTCGGSLVGREATFEVRQPGRGPWHLCSLACLVEWGRLWTVRLRVAELAEADR